ncbi:mucin-binding protein, partial [Bartonella sp. CL63NXGY]|uniref:mucin-binding protein n=1 Tax=Bartonella sp. CL63NXGY TaxID=3243538 RepID=UPI0035D113F9
TETVYEKDPVSGEEKQVANFPLVFTRTGVKDEVTGKTTWTEWEAKTKDQNDQVLSNFPEVNVTKPGYSATSADGSVKKTDDGKFIVPASAKIDPDQ